MSYVKTNWQDLPNQTTPITASRLNNMENGIANSDGAIGVNEYSSSSTYAIGDYCLYNNKLYKCKVAISIAEAWNLAHWQETKITTEIDNTQINLENATKTSLQTEEAKELEITDCAGVSGKLSIKSGDTEQAQYEGNQLIDFANPTSINNTNYTFNNNILTVTADTTQSSGFNSINYNITDFIKANPGKVLKFTCKSVDLSNFNSTSSTVVQLAITTSGGTTYPVLAWKASASSMTYGSYTIPDDTSDITRFRFFVYCNNASTSVESTTIIEEPMLQFGTEEKEYEPYVGGTASPSPDYPQDIVSIGSNVNLLDINYYEQGGINETTGEDVSQVYSARGSNYISVKPNTYYILNANTICNTMRLAEYSTSSSSGFIQRNQEPSTKNITIKTTATTKYLRWTVNYNNSTEMTETLAKSLNFKLEQGSQASGYSKYNCGSVDFLVKNKNIHGGYTFSKTNGGVTYTYNTNGTILANGTVSGNSYSMVTSEAINNKLYYILKPATYVLKGGSSKVSIQLMEIVNDSSSTLQETGYSINAKIFTITEEKKVFLRVQGKSGQAFSNEIIYPMLAKSNTDIPFVEHQEQKITIPLPVGVELCKIGNNKDKIEDNKKYNAINELILNGTESWSYQSTENRFVLANITPALTSARYLSLCSHFIYGSTDDNDLRFFITTNNSLLIRYDAMQGNVENFKTWLASNNVKIKYVLATPTYTEITDTDTLEGLYQLEHLLMYEGYTTIECLNEVKPDIQAEYLYNNEINNTFGSIIDELSERIHLLEIGE